MEENDYTPNVFARGLGLGTMKTVGIICPDISDSYMSKAVSYLEGRLHEYGYDCILGCSGFKQKEKENYVNLLLSKKIDTLVLVGSTYAGNGKDEDDTDYIREAAEQTPIFIINGRVCGKNIYCACADDYHATYEVTKAMIRRGRERILFIMAISSEPELTSVDSKLNVLCKTTVDHMISLLEKQEEIEKNVVVPCGIVKRCTTDF